MKIGELYEKMSAYFPKELSCDWDNDGLMCCPDRERTVKKALCVLDITESAVDYAIENSFDLIVSHHPLIFRPLSSVDYEKYPSKKIIKLLQNGISAFSFHTRADCVSDGVNDMLAEILEIENVASFGEDGMGRIGDLAEPCTLSAFAKLVKEKLDAPYVNYCGENQVKKVALLGGDGKDFVMAAKEAGADTYLSGSISYNVLLEAPEYKINLLEAGHFHTEAHIKKRYAQILREISPDIITEEMDFNPILSI